MLRRIERLNPSLNAFAQVTSERALVEARAAEQEIMRGRARGLLHGVPVAAKDLFQVRGTVTTAGSLIFGGRRANTDATAVARLEQAGAVLVGTTHLHELALGVNGREPPLWPKSEIPGILTGCREDRAGDLPWRSRQACASRHSARTQGEIASGSRRASAACQDSNPPTGGSAGRA